MEEEEEEEEEEEVEEEEEEDKLHLWIEHWNTITCSLDPTNGLPF